MNDLQAIPGPAGSGHHLLPCSPAQARILRGAMRLAAAVRATLGPRPKAMRVWRRIGVPVLCNDGVAIAREVELDDPDEHFGARILSQAAERTGQVAGDGTSTAIVLAQAILAEGIRQLAAGASAVGLERGLHHAGRAAVDALRRLSQPIASRREKIQVATTAAHQQPGLGELAVDALERVGSGGVIRVEQSTTTETSVELFAGMQFAGGYLRPYFVTSAERMEVELEDAFVLLAGRKIDCLKDVVPLLDQVARTGRPLLVVAEDIEGEALAALIVDLLGGRLQSCAVRAPGLGEHRRAVLQDLAALTGGTVVAEAPGCELGAVRLAQLGCARRVVVDSDSTTIMVGGGRAAIEARSDELRREIVQAAGDDERQKLEDRLAKLAGGVAVMHVGARSAAATAARMTLLGKAISATRAALAEGAVPGGGLALLLCIEAVAAEERNRAGDERKGAQILRRALEAPARRIVENAAGKGDAAAAPPTDRAGDLGIDVAHPACLGLVEAGIIDATKVVRIALENAISLASMLLLTLERPADLPEGTEQGGTQEMMATL